LGFVANRQGTLADDGMHILPAAPAGTAGRTIEGVSMDLLKLQTLENAPGLLLAYGLNFLAALLLLVGGWFAAGWSQRSVRRALDRMPRLDSTLKPIAARFVRYAVLVIAIIAVLGQFGIQTTSIIALIGAAGLAVGLALQGTLSHVASGMIILFLRPFGIGDQIDAEGISGTVREIGLFATELETIDGIYVMIPNGLIIGRSVKNYSRLPRRRLDMVVGLTYDNNIEKALAVALSVLKQDERVLNDPAPQAVVKDLADTAVRINLRCWTASRDYWDLFYELQKAIKLRFDHEGVRFHVLGAT
jgi:small conductance mechanosensitive channel